MLSLEDDKALEETAYLLRTPANAKRQLSAAAQLNSEKGVERDLPPVAVPLIRQEVRLQG